MRKHVSTLLLVCVALLAGCDNDRDARDPLPGHDFVATTKAARIAPVSVGQPFELDGCKVQVHDVFVSYPGTIRADSSFTLATANCPTANVSATERNCGKNCRQKTIRLEPTTGADTVPITEPQRDDEQENQLAMRKAAERAVLQAKEAQLKADLGRVSKQLQDNP